MRQMSPFNIRFIFPSCTPEGPFENPWASVRRQYMENIWKLSMPLSICWWTEIELQVWAHYSDNRCARVAISQRRRRGEVPAARYERRKYQLWNANNLGRWKQGTIIVSLLVFDLMNIMNVFGESKIINTSLLFLCWYKICQEQCHISPQYQKDFKKELYVVKTKWKAIS